ncbi:hypothetical protein ACFFX0_04460 [Citricoccus parietis]|uniref:Uncharacterized protein n=1 Tax=Citricoccus parietis TaxID=592307 RepID=A0ABV5FV16_9MICC
MDRGRSSTSIRHERARFRETLCQAGKKRLPWCHEHRPARGPGGPGFRIRRTSGGRHRQA